MLVTGGTGVMYYMTMVNNRGNSTQLGPVTVNGDIDMDQDWLTYAYCPMAPSHYLTEYPLIFKDDLWHPIESKFA